MTEYDPQNVFARILRQEIPANIVYEDSYALAFHDINPHASVHVLVIPKGAYTCFSDFTEMASAEEVMGFYKAVDHVSQLLNVRHDGFRLIINQGIHGGQEVPHYHVHILGGGLLPTLQRCPKST